MKRAQSIVPRSQRQQTGIALISMLLVFGLVVILVGSAISNTSLNITKASYHLQYSQAYQYALGGEALARQILHRDWQDDQENDSGDHLGEHWAQPFQFEPDRGLMRVQIRDLDGRFNLNSLLDQDGKSTSNAAPLLTRLLYQLDISTPIDTQIVDWIDRDTQPQTPQSEDTFFLSSEAPYRSADQPLSHLSELVAAQLDTDEQSVIEFQAHTTVLPEWNSPINLNTAGRELLASFHKDLNPDEVIRVRSDLKNGFSNKQEFEEHEVTAGLNLDALNLDVYSQYFEVWVIAQFNDQSAYLRSVLHRDKETGAVRTLHRNQSRSDHINPFMESSLNDKKPSPIKDND